MAQFYTIEEAAAKVGLSVDDFKRNLATKWTNVSRFPDGRSIRFKADQIDELARTLGRGSEPDLQLADEPLTLDDETDFVALQDDSDDAMDVVPGGKTKKKTGSDSDVKLEPASGKLPKLKEPTEVNLDAEVTSKPPSSTRKFAAPLDIASEADVNLRPPAKGDTGSSSEFELSLAPDSSDEIELRLSDDSSDEIDIGVMPGKAGLSSGNSGINLQSPTDSGISLEKSSDFELDIASDSSIKTQPKSGDPKSGGPKSGSKKPTVPEDSDSEFELTLDDSGESAAGSDSTSAFQEPESKDIFETDFELPTLDEESGSEVEPLGETDLESSDFDLALGEDDAPSEEESDSEVVAIEESGRRGRRVAAVDDEEYDDLAEAEDEEEVAPARAGKPAEWGVLPGLVLLPCVAVMFLTGIMAFELLHSMWGYHSPSKPSAPLVRFVAEMFGNELPKE